MAAKSTDRKAEEVAGWLFAQDLSAYAGQWVAALPGGIVAHGSSLKEVMEEASRLPSREFIRYYAVPGEIQAT